MQVFSDNGSILCWGNNEFSKLGDFLKTCNHNVTIRVLTVKCVQGEFRRAVSKVRAPCRTYLPEIETLRKTWTLALERY